MFKSINHITHDPLAIYTKHKCEFKLIMIMKGELSWIVRSILCEIQSVL